MSKYQVIWMVLGVIYSLTSCTGEQGENVAEQHINVKEAQTQEVDSIDWVNAQLKVDPNNPYLYLQKARLLVDRKKPHAAMADLQRAIKVDSLDANVWAQKAKTEFDLKYYAECKFSAERALKINPENIEANIRMAWLYLALNNYDQVFVSVNKVLKKDVYHAEAYYLKGMAYKYLEKYALAVSSLRTATEQDNDYYDAWVQLGAMYMLNNDLTAIQYFDNAIKIDPKKVDAHHNKAFFYQERGMAREALSAYEELNKHKPEFFPGWFSRGYIYLMELNEYDSAITCYDKVIGINPFSYAGYYNRGLAFESKDEFNKALENYNKALELKPDYDLAAKGKERVVSK